jgi:hypothetical protein
LVFKWVDASPEKRVAGTLEKKTLNFLKGIKELKINLF